MKAMMIAKVTKVAAAVVLTAAIGSTGPIAVKVFGQEKGGGPAAEEAKKDLSLETYGTIHSAGVYILDASPETNPVPHREDVDVSLASRLAGTEKIDDSVDEMLTLEEPAPGQLRAPDAPSLSYREKGGERWREGMPLVEIPKIPERPSLRFAGSLFHLKPATTYEVRVVLKGGDGKEIETLVGEVTTRSGEVVYGKGRTLRVGKEGGLKSIQEAVREARPGDTVLIASGVYYGTIGDLKTSGEPGQPVVVRGEKGAILDGADPKFVETDKGYWKPLSQVAQTSAEVKNITPAQIEGVYWAEADYALPPLMVCTAQGRLDMTNEEFVVRNKKSSWRYDRNEKRLYIRLPNNTDPNKEPIYIAQHGLSMDIRNSDHGLKNGDGKEIETLVGEGTTHPDEVVGEPGQPVVIRGEKGAILDGVDPKFVEIDKGYWKPLSQVAQTSIEVKQITPAQIEGVYWVEADYALPPSMVCTAQGRLYMRKPQDERHVVRDEKSSWRYDRNEKRLYIRLPNNADPNKEPIYIARYGRGMSIQNSNHLIVEGLTIRHYGQWDGKGCCFSMWNCSHCVVQNCTFLNGADQVARVIGESSCNLIQYCYMSDPLYGPEHTWGRGTAYATHRTGYGLTLSGARGNVVRYNRFGDEKNHSADNLQVGYVGPEGCMDTDVYENYLEGAQDDAIETEDGGCCNVRIWGNTIVRSRCIHSVVPVYTGPVYIFRNVYRGWSMGAVKTARSGGGERSLGTVYVYHNTFVNTSQANLIHGPPRQFTKLRFVNNIFFAPGAEQPKDANDLFENNFFGDPLLSDPAGLDFTPKESSPVIDKAIRLSGLNDDISGAAPDIGAIEFGLGWLGKTLKRPPEKGPWQ